MHLVVPYAAAAGEAGASALQGLRLPHLERLLALLTPAAPSQADAETLNLPHEHLLAACRGWRADDGRLPFAAWSARADGLPTADVQQGWGLLTPSHWQVGSEQVLLLDPAQLHLDEDESRALMQALRPLFEPDGWALHWGARLRWYATHPSLHDLATASLDRVVGQAIDSWLPDRQAGRLLRRLQSEAQMLLYTHPINAAREQRGELAVNSFWLSGTGPTRLPGVDDDEPDVDDRLCAPWRAGDWVAWVEAWHSLDAQRMATLVSRARSGEPLRLSLCGPRSAVTFENAARSPWQRLTQPWRRVDSIQLLATL